MRQTGAPLGAGAGACYLLLLICYYICCFAYTAQITTAMLLHSEWCLLQGLLGVCDLFTECCAGPKTHIHCDAFLVLATDTLKNSHGTAIHSHFLQMIDRRCGGGAFVVCSEWVVFSSPIVWMCACKCKCIAHTYLPHPPK